jgi:hypothetical protein
VHALLGAVMPEDSMAGKRRAAQQADKIFTHKQTFDNDAGKQTPLKPKPWKAKTWEYFENEIANKRNFGKPT